MAAGVLRIDGQNAATINGASVKVSNNGVIHLIDSVSKAWLLESAANGISFGRYFFIRP